MSDHQNNDPLEFVRGLWGNMGFSLPGMVAPTFDVDELEKRINDLKAVEGWLRMNLSMLQMTIQGLEMQRATVTAVKAMGQMASEAAEAVRHSHEPEAPAPEEAPAPSDGDAASAFSQAAMWPWNLMQQMQEHLQQQAAAVQAAQPAPAAEKPKAKPAAKKPAAPRRKKTSE